MRVYFLWIAIAVIFFVGFRNWFLPFCALIVLSAFMENQDMPTNIAGIPGLNPWNLLLAIVLFHWFTQRFREGLRWDLRGGPLLILCAYVAMVVIGCARAAIDVQSFWQVAGRSYSITGLIADELVNPLRYMIPGLLLYDGCRDRKRAKMAIAAIILMGFCYAAFVVKYIPIGTLLGSEPVLRSRKRIDREIGLHANDMAFVLVFVFWSLVASWPLIKKTWLKFASVSAGVVIALGLALCESRAGFIGAVVVGTAIAALRRPVLLLLLPIVIIVVPIGFPGIAMRLGMGFGEVSATGDTVQDWDEITAGRTSHLWPASIEFIRRAPIFGYGRYAILRVKELHDDVLAGEGSVPTHPHNAYLEVMLDYGGIGLAITLTLFTSIGVISIKQMKDRTDTFVRVIGTITFAAALDNLVVGLSSRALLPRPSAMAMWCMMAMTLRLWVEQRRAMVRSPRAVFSGALRLQHE